MLYTLVHICFTLCSDCTEFHRELATLKEIFQRNGYPRSFIAKCFKKFLDRLHVIKTTSSTAEKKGLTLSIPLFGTDFLTSQNQNQKWYKEHFKSLKTSIMFKNERKISNMFRFKDRVPCNLFSAIVYENASGRCNSS